MKHNNKITRAIVEQKIWNAERRAQLKKRRTVHAIVLGDMADAARWRRELAARDSNRRTS